MLILNDGHGGVVAAQATLRDRLRAVIQATRLDAQIAAGRSPDDTVQLALRAQRLTSTSFRRGLATGAGRLYAAGWSAAKTPVPVRQARVRMASGELQRLVERLLAPGPVTARGAAQTAALLSDAWGAAYGRGTAADLVDAVRGALAALEPMHETAR